MGNFKSSDLYSFISDQLPPSASHESKCIVIYNASIYKTNEVGEAFAQKNYILKFLPLYPPQLNPIEEFFSCLKARVKQRGTNNNRKKLIRAIEDVLAEKEFYMEGYFNNIRRWMAK